jgi:hypothetical protein
MPVILCSVGRSCLFDCGDGFRANLQQLADLVGNELTDFDQGHPLPSIPALAREMRELKWTRSLPDFVQHFAQYPDELLPGLGQPFLRPVAAERFRPDISVAFVARKHVHVIMAEIAEGAA